MDLDFSKALDAVRAMANSIILALPNLVLAALVLGVFLVAAGFARTGVRSLAARASRSSPRRWVPPS